MLKRFLTILTLIIFCGSFTSVFSATYTSIASGLWSSASTWQSGSIAPTSGNNNKIYISNGNNDTLTGNITFGNGCEIHVYGSLVINGDLTVNNNLLIDVTGTFTITGNVNINNNGTINLSNGTLDIGGNMTGGNGCDITGTGTINLGGANNFDNSPGSGIHINAGLPVELLSFDYSVASNKVLLNWATSSETNNDFFTIERSTDGIYYDIIATISGAGNSNSILNYHFVDENPIDGTSYYRLKQTDFDGKFEYVGTIACKFNSGNSTTFTVINSVVIDNISINLSGESGNYTIAIYNYFGRKVFESNYSLNSSSANLSIPFNAVKGYYILSILAADGTSNSFKLFKE